MKLYIVIIPKKKRFQTLLKGRNRLRVFDVIRWSVPDYRCMIWKLAVSISHDINRMNL